MNWFTAILALIGLTTLAILPVYLFHRVYPLDNPLFAVIWLGGIGLSNYLDNRRGRSS
ncbi:MAG TPA: hypothetical protein PJ982_04485 [Lacipirellulaceae bacterium]|nr:hypothetical protein [Lacipirellulaceae bacterium]